MGLTFKENVPDVRNTKVVDIIKELMDYGIQVIICDPCANPEEVKKEYSLTLSDYYNASGVDAVVIAVAHDEYRKIPLNELKLKFAPDRSVIADIKGLYDRKDAEKFGFTYWRL